MVDVKRPRGRPRSPAYDERREQIAAAAAALFVRRGAGSVSMDEIANEVGLAKPSLYHYFRTKDEILFAIHVQASEFLTSRLEARAARHVSAAERLRGVFVDTFALVDTLPGYSRVVLEHLRQLPEDLQAKVVANREQHSLQIQGIFQDGIASGEFVDDTDTHLLSLALLGMVNWSHQWYSHDGRYTPEELADRFFAIFFDGIRPRSS